MNTTTIATKEQLLEREDTVDVLWGAWIKQTKYNETHRTLDISGIYENISKKGKSDFPFITDLNLVLALRVLERGEVGQIHKVIFRLCDKYGVYNLFEDTRAIEVPAGDFPLWWYDTFVFNSVLISEPDLYGLHISIEDQFKLHIPLWVSAPKVIDIDSGQEWWFEDWLEEHNLGE